MKTRHRTVLLGGLMAALATGCLEDKAAKERSQVQTALAEATAQLRVATIAPIDPEDQHAASVEAALDSVVSRLAGVNGGEPGQRTAKGMLAATAHRELAAMDHGRADAVEQQHRDARAVLRGKLDALLDLEALAVALADQQGADELAMLDDAEAQTDSDLALVSEAIAALDEPIAEREATNSSDSREVDRLRQEADARLRQASEAGHADGFTTYEEAIDLRRQADQIEFEIGWRETELGYQLQPEHDRATLVADQLQAQIGVIGEGRANIQALAAVNQREAGANRQAAQALSGEIESGIDAIARSSSTDLAASYESAAAHLDQAATLATQAARQAQGDGASAANLVVARIHEQQGRLRADQVRGLADQQSLLTRLVDTLGDEYRPTLNEVSTQLSEAQQAAQAAFDRAIQALDEVRIRRLDAQLQALKQNIGAASAALVGESVPIAIAAPAPSASTGGGQPAGGAPAPAAGQGFPTPEALAQYLNTLDWTNLGTQMQVLNVTRPTSPESKANLDALRSAVSSMNDFVAAMQETYGDAAAPIVKAMGAGASMGGGMQQVAVQSQEGDRATASFSTGMGQTATIDLVSQNGAWYLDAASVGTLGAPPGTSLNDMTKMLSQMGQAMSSLAQRVRGGEFADVTAAQMAFSQEMMQVMSSMMGGAPQQ